MSQSEQSEVRGPEELILSAPQPAQPQDRPWSEEERRVLADVPNGNAPVEGEPEPSLESNGAAEEETPVLQLPTEPDTGFEATLIRPDGAEIDGAENDGAEHDAAPEDDLSFEQPPVSEGEAAEEAGEEAVAEAVAEESEAPPAAPEPAPLPVVDVALEQDERGWFIADENWGFADAEGNVRIRGTELIEERVIGPVREENVGGTLVHYLGKFKELEKQFSDAVASARSAEDKGKPLARVRRLLDLVPKAEALGNFDSLLTRLRELEGELLQTIEQRNIERREKKEALCERAAVLGQSSEWKSAAEQFKALFEEWKGVGSAGREQDDLLWKRFQEARDQFYQRRSQHFDQRDREREENREKKEALCVRAEAFSNSTEWKKTDEALRALQAEWKAVGSAGRDHDDLLWKRFRGAQDEFYERRTAFYKDRDRERKENLAKKEALCQRAEALASADDSFGVIQEIRQLQEEWKKVGQVPKEKSDALWKRFRGSCDRIFNRADEERKRRRDEWRDRLRETLERKQEQADRLRESIRHDEANIARWEESLAGLRDGRRAEEMRYSLETKIADVKSRVQGKLERLEELDGTIRELEAKLK